MERGDRPYRSAVLITGSGAGRFGSDLASLTLPYKTLYRFNRFCVPKCGYGPYRRECERGTLPIEDFNEPSRRLRGSEVSVPAAEAGQQRLKRLVGCCGFLPTSPGNMTYALVQELPVGYLAQGQPKRTDFAQSLRSRHSGRAPVSLEPDAAGARSAAWDQNGPEQRGGGPIS